MHPDLHTHVCLLDTRVCLLDLHSQYLCLCFKPVFPGQDLSLCVSLDLDRYPSLLAFSTPLRPCPGSASCYIVSAFHLYIGAASVSAFQLYIGARPMSTFQLYIGAALTL